MLILAVFWIAYTVYRTVCLVINHAKYRETKLSCIIELSSDFFMGISLLLLGHILPLLVGLPFYGVIRL